MTLCNGSHATVSGQGMSGASAVAARLKLKRSAPPSEEPARAAPSAPLPPALVPSAPVPATGGYSEGATVEGNFKGFGDWDEALIVGKNSDGTYTLEYVDEGLIEDSVDVSRIRLPQGDDGADDGAPSSFAEGETVLGNFRGLGDWDEALILGKNPDGTYMLEYVDEGLIEKSVDVSRIAKAGSADAEAAAGISLAVDDEEERLGAAYSAGGSATHAPPEANDDDGEEEEEDDDEEEEEESDTGGGDNFKKSSAWRGARAGFCFKAGDRGVGYYRDVPLHEAAEAEERAKIVLTAPQIANWIVELSTMPPSVDKVDRLMDLYDLTQLRVQALGKGKPGQSPYLFESLNGWFGAQQAHLAQRVPNGAIEVNLRVFLAPQQSVRMGIQHVTFSVDWVRVQTGDGAADEPIARALLRRLGMGDRCPPKMLLVVMYRAEKNKITHVWADVDREGLGAKKGATLDDVLLSDVFDACLTLARKGGAVGSLDPLFYNYYEAECIG